MDVLHACCAGLDVHKRTVVACVRRVDPAGKVTTNIQTTRQESYEQPSFDSKNLSTVGLVGES